MAFSSRLKSAVRPLYQTAKFVSPTAAGVLLSLGVHVLFFAFGPRTSFSFAALSEAAQQEEAEETIVPIVQLTPAERSRLPAFAQPRVLPPSPTGLSDSLGLPSDLSSPNSRRRLPQSTPAKRLPSPTLPARRPTANSTLQVPRATNRTTISSPIFRTLPSPSSRQMPPVSVLPPSSTQAPNVTTGNLSITSGGGSSSAGTALPNLPAAGEGASSADLQTAPRSIEDALATIESDASSEDTASSRETQSPATSESTNDSADARAESQTEPTDIAVLPSDSIDVAPAQGDSSRLLEGFVYDPTSVSQAEADANLQAWLAETAENKSKIETQQAKITIDSNFKVCKENPPVDGLIGVVVNPDGSQEQAKVLRSIGYDLLNRQALDAIERRDFGQPSTPTQYQVSVEVVYQPEGCVEELPTANEDIDG